VETILPVNRHSIARCRHDHKDNYRHTKDCYVSHDSICFICNVTVSNPVFELYSVTNSYLNLLYHPFCATGVGLKNVYLPVGDGGGQKVNTIVVVSEKIIQQCENCKIALNPNRSTTIIRDGRKIYLCAGHFGNNKCFICWKRGDGQIIEYVEIKGPDGPLYHHTTCIPDECGICSRVIYDGNWFERLVEPKKIINTNTGIINTNTGIINSNHINTTKVMRKIHLGCEKDGTCVKCGIEGNGTMLIEKYEFRHYSCLPNKCDVCRKVIGPFPRKDIGDIGKNQFTVHESCANTLICFICNTSGGDIIFEKGFLRHRGCVNDICKSCSIVIGPDPCENIGDTTRYHLKCLKILKCYICGFIGGDFVYGKGGIHHRQLCTPNVCPVCGDVIGPAPSSTINEETYHDACVDEIKCYACGEPGKGKKIIDVNRHNFENRFIHDKCSSAKCEECELFIGAAPIRVVNDKLYHGGIMPHGPKCHICKEFTSDDFGRLLPIDDDNDTKYTPKKYRHTTCSKDECVVCLKVLGKVDNRCFVTPDGKVYEEPKEITGREPEEITGREPEEIMGGEEETKIRKIEIHLACTRSCHECGEAYVDYNYMAPPTRDGERNTFVHIVRENWKYLPVYFQQMAVSTWLSVRKVAPFIDKNIIKKLIELVLSEIPDIERMLPMKRGMFDFSKICTTNCINKSKCVCGKDFTWDVKNRMKCSAKRCIYAVKAFQDIMSIAYKKQQHFTWPGTEEQGIKAATLAILDAQPQDSVVCDVKFRAVERLLSGRRK